MQMGPLAFNHVDLRLDESRDDAVHETEDSGRHDSGMRQSLDKVPFLYMLVSHDRRRCLVIFIEHIGACRFGVVSDCE